MKNRIGEDGNLEVQKPVRKVCLQHVGHEEFFRLMDKYGVEAYREGPGHPRETIGRIGVNLAFSGGAAPEIFIEIPEEGAQWITSAPGSSLINYINSFLAGEPDASKLDPDGKIREAFRQRGLEFRQDMVPPYLEGTHAIGTLREGIIRFLYQLGADFSSRVAGLDEVLLHRPFNDIDFPPAGKRVVRMEVPIAETLSSAVQRATSIALRHNCIVGFAFNDQIITVDPDEVAR